MRKKQLQSLLALLLALLMVLSSTSALAAVKPGETISSDSKWINSDIQGAVDENTVVSLKDDFHTAVNLDWLLTSEDGLGNFGLSGKLIHQRKLDIVLNQAEIDPANADAIGLSSEWLAHDLKLVQTFSSLAGEWEYRNANGVEPARPFLDAITSIKTMDELDEYMFNANGMNITGLALANIKVSPDPETQSVYTATISPIKRLSLPSQDDYTSITDAGMNRHFGNDEAVHYLLGRLGYSAHEINDILRRCYNFEGRLAANMSNTMFTQSVSYLTSGKSYTLEALTALAGNYPIARQLEIYGIAPQDAYLVFEPSYLQALGNLYNAGNLEDIKAMLMVHTVCELIALLDVEAYDKTAEIFASVSAISREDITKPIGQNEQELADWRKDAAAFVFDNYLLHYLPGPMDQIYVAAYCTPELKADVTALIHSIIDYYREMIQEVDWLSEKTRAATIEKLDSIIIRCAYPDQFVDYTGLTLKGCRNNQGGTLPEAIAAINLFHRNRTMAKVGQAVDRHEWDMSAEYMSTSVCNANYRPQENSVNILAGFLTDIMYTPDMPYEKLLGTVGAVIAHEITHAFDTQGYKFDKEGRLNPWWSLADVEAFDLRANRLIRYYDSLTPYPSAFAFYSGSNVSAEAIADMGAVKCMLQIAKSHPDFDYELFFRSYAELWRTRNTLAEEKSLFDDDSHPLAFLRTNVTLMQFEEFQKTFDIQPGDGMYLAPEKRINVW